ncbi:MAG: lysophospholipid acyltransferase family protein [Candidatus Limnocylindria bacterium]
MTRDAQRGRTGPRELSVSVTARYRVMWWVNRAVIRTLFDVRVSGLDGWPAPPFQLVANHHNGADPLVIMAALPLDPRITWFGPREADFSRGFKNRVMAFFGGVIPVHPELTTLTSAVRAVRRVFEANGVLGIFAEGRIGFRESDLLDFEDGAASFAIASGVAVVPCAVVGTTHLWFRKRLSVRFGPPILPDGARGRRARAELERHAREAVRELLPPTEPSLPSRRPLAFLTDLLNGRDDIERRASDDPASLAADRDADG